MTRVCVHPHGHCCLHHTCFCTPTRTLLSPSHVFLYTQPDTAVSMTRVSVHPHGHCCLHHTCFCTARTLLSPSHVFLYTHTDTAVSMTRVCVHPHGHCCLHHTCLCTPTRTPLSPSHECLQAVFVYEINFLASEDTISSHLHCKVIFFERTGFELNSKTCTMTFTAFCSKDFLLCNFQFSILAYCGFPDSWPVENYLRSSVTCVISAVEHNSD